MTMWLRADTLQTIRFGPFLDSTDGVTAETALTIAQADRQVSKDGAAFAQSSTAGNATHDTDGWYSADISATDTDTEGILILQVVVAGALPVWHQFHVVAANVYDSIILGTDALQVHANEITAGLITAAAIATDAIDADAIAATATAEIADAVWDENIEADHGTDATAGLLLRALGQNVSNETHDANLLDQLKRIIAIVEHQRGGHTHQPQGNIFFVDPVNGNTHASGNRGGISDPYAGVQDAHDNAVTAANHDIIFLLAGNTTSPTTLSEDVNLTKDYLSIRGPGRDFLWNRADAGDVITSSADGLNLFGFRLQTAGTGTGNGITVTGADFFKAEKLWIQDTQGDAIQMTDCDNFVIKECNLQGAGAGGAGHGIQLIAGAAETGNYGEIIDNYIHDTAGDGIQIDTTGGGSVLDPTMHGNFIQGSTDDGIDIVDAGVVNAFIADNRFGNNVGNDIEDAGTGTVILNNVQWAKAGAVKDDLDDLNDLSAAQVNAEVDTALTDYDGPTHTELIAEIDAVQADIAALNDPTAATIADAVWDEDIDAAHQTANTAGKRLDDASTSVAGLNDLSAAEVNAEVVDALNVDTYAEPGTGAPPATTSLAAKINYMFKFMRNRVTVNKTTDEISVYNDNATTVGQKSSHSDDGTIYDRGEFGSG